MYVQLLCKGKKTKERRQRRQVQKQPGPPWNGPIVEITSKFSQKKAHHFREWKAGGVGRFQFIIALLISIKDVDIIYKAFGSPEGFKQE